MIVDKIKKIITTAFFWTEILLFVVITCSILYFLNKYLNDNILFYKGEANLTPIIVYFAYCLFAAAFLFFLNKNKLKERYLLLGLAAFTLIIQTALHSQLILTYETDLQFNFDNALLIFEHGKINSLYHAIFPHTVTYSSFLAAFMKLFGTGRYAPIMLNGLACVGIVFCVYYLAKKYLPKSWAAAAAMSVALNPVFIVYSGTSNAEILYGLFMILAVLVYLNSNLFKLDEKKVFLLILTGVLCGFADFFRPIALILLITIVIHQLLIHDEPLKTKFASIILITVSFFAINSSTKLTASKITGYPYPTSSFGWNLYVGSSENGVWNWEDAALFSQKEQEYGSPSEVQEFFADKAFERYKQMGTELPRHGLKKLFAWISPYTRSVLEKQTDESAFLDYNLKSVYNFISLYEVTLLLLTLSGCLLVSYQSLIHKVYNMQIPVIYLLGSMILLMIVETSGRYTVSYRIVFHLIGIYFIYKSINAIKPKIKALRKKAID